MSALAAPRRHPLDGPPVRVMLVDLTRAASEHFGVAEPEIRSRSRVARIVAPRHAIVHLAMTRFEFSSAEVGRFFHRDHTTMLTANSETAARAAGDPEFAEELSGIEIAALVHARLRQTGLLRAAPEIDPAAAAWRIVKGGAREAARASIQEIMAMADALSRLEDQPEQEHQNV